VYGDANDFKNFWPRFAVDPETYFSLYPEFQLSPDQLAAFKKERNACVIGRKLAQQHGFKLGDVITMEGISIPAAGSGSSAGSIPVGTRRRMRPKCSSSTTTSMSKSASGSPAGRWTPGFTS